MKLVIPTKADYRRHLEKYSPYTCSEDWIKWGIRIIPYRANRMVRLIERYIKKDAKILDLGCGIGLSLHVTAQVFPNIIGCDLDESAIKGSREILRKVGKSGVPLKLYDGRKLPFRSHSLDAVLSIEVVEHTNKVDQMLKEIKRVLKKDGVVIITTPNKYWPLETHYRLPFLAYLSPKLADFYVRVTKKGEKYDVYPLSYIEFSNKVGKYFNFEDITLDIIKNYKEFKLDEERGDKVKYIALVLKILQYLKLKPLEKMVTLSSAGWVFVARAKK